MRTRRAILTIVAGIVGATSSAVLRTGRAVLAVVARTVRAGYAVTAVLGTGGTTLAIIAGAVGTTQPAIHGPATTVRPRTALLAQLDAILGHASDFARTIGTGHAHPTSNFFPIEAFVSIAIYDTRNKGSSIETVVRPGNT